MKIYSNETIKVKINKQIKIKKIFRIIFYIIAIFIAICALSVLYQRFIQKEKSVSLFGYSSYIILSGSMQPTLMVNDIVIVKNVKEDKLKEGDIITFIDDQGNIITHRIKSIIIKDGQKYFQTKGDNNNADDIGLISIKNIKGKYCFKINQGGKVISVIFSPVGILFLALIVLLIFLYINRKNNRKIARHLLRERYKKQEKNSRSDSNDDKTMDL